MERTYILGNNSNLEQLGGVYVEIPKLSSENESHNWITELFSNNKVDKVVIEIEKDPILSLQIGYHIRLSIESIKEGVLIPIMFISKLSLNSVLLQTGLYSQILATKGVTFSDYNLPVNKVEIEHLNGLDDREYLINFLKLIHIQPDETIGRHSLANIWGAYAMDKASNVNALPIQSEFKKGLYFKYVSAFNNLDKIKPSRLKVIGNVNVGKANRINAEGKRILLIDDEASNGWETVLKKIFKTSSPEDFVVINEKVKGFEELSEASQRIIETETFDLYLVDLRLNGLDEDENIKTESFSGMQILKKIKSLNEGNQVIIFSASNKVWNLKAILDAKADGYYMKESPEYNFSNFISEQNYIEFKENAQKCFKRSYLREIYTEWESANNQNTNSDNEFIAESDTSLKIAWDQIKSNNLDFGFLTLFQSLESFANKLYLIDDNEDSIEGVVTIDKTDHKEHKWLMTFNKDRKIGNYFAIGESMQEGTIRPTALYKVSCLFRIKYQKDENFLKIIGSLNSKRNRIAHDGAKGFVSQKDLIQILKILGEIRSK